MTSSRGTIRVIRLIVQFELISLTSGGFKIHKVVMANLAILNFAYNPNMGK